jgi:tripeptidyl-peptidase-1
MFKPTITLSLLLAAIRANPLVLEKRDSPPIGFSRIRSTLGDKILSFRLALAQNDVAGLHDTVYDVSTPGSPRYGQYLTKEEVPFMISSVSCH